MSLEGRFQVGVCVALLSLLGAPVIAVASTASSRSERGDRAFLDQALGVNELELRLGRLAAERAVSPDVKAMGATMVTKHTALREQLGALAKASGATPRAELSAEEQATFARLSSLPRGDFDGEFKRTVSDGHVKELAMYRDEVPRTENPRLRALAAERVAALEKSVAGAASGGAMR